MRIGLQVPAFNFPGGTERIAPEFARIAREADQAGLASLWVMDHFFQIPSVGEAEEPMLEAYTTLAYAAAVTERITLGTMVTGVNYRHPGVLIKTVTTLDVLSGGRAWLGIGAGWFEEEARGLGLPFPPLGERFEWLEETLRLADRMWKGDESPVHGRHFTFERPLNSPQPLRRPPILVGGGGEKKTLRFVARYADACNLFAGAPDLERKLEVLREHCEREGRPYEEIEKTVLATLDAGASVEETLDEIGRLGALGIDQVIFSAREAHKVTDLVAEVNRRL
ncbi:LLM class F420-dependent oxidoreductase [Thermomonospora amylolytica]|uniref:LLM class F420-dependent oxidoreductase n=1 Tax=Thermomonospora amylolytica TaxID=1411117 RepID=UPI000E6BC742|nr:LLM class F420-dependent oxidoreductase [Thermomonospora amylolytica]